MHVNSSLPCITTDLWESNIWSPQKKKNPEKSKDMPVMSAQLKLKWKSLHYRLYFPTRRGWLHYLFKQILIERLRYVSQCCPTIKNRSIDLSTSFKMRTYLKWTVTHIDTLQQDTVMHPIENSTQDWNPNTIAFNILCKRLKLAVTTTIIDAACAQVKACCIYYNHRVFYISTARMSPVPDAHLIHSCNLFEKID